MQRKSKIQFTIVGGTVTQAQLTQHLYKTQFTIHTNNTLEVNNA